MSVILSSLPEKYIESSKKLITTLEEYKFDVQYAYWYLRYDENQTWIDGDWRLLISSEYVNSHGLRNGYSCIQKIFEITKENILDLQDVELVEFDGGDVHKHFILERIDIK